MKKINGVKSNKKMHPQNFHKPSRSKYPEHKSESSEYPKWFWKGSQGTYTRSGK